MNHFGNIPENILNIRLHEFEGAYKSVAEMISEVTKEPVETAKFMVTASDRGLDLVSLRVWTNSKQLTLRYTTLGAYFIIDPIIQVGEERH